MQDPLLQAETSLAKEFNDAPRELKAIVQLIFTALEKKRAGQNTCGEMLNNLRKADRIVKSNQLKNWEAELHAVWALYYRRGCPNLENSNKTEDDLMWHHIAQAHRLEPDNQTLKNILTEIKQTKS